MKRIPYIYIHIMVFFLALPAAAGAEENLDAQIIVDQAKMDLDELKLKNYWHYPEEYIKRSSMLHPELNSDVSKSKIATCHDLSIENVFVGNGSDEILIFTFLAFFKRNKPIVFQGRQTDSMRFTAALSTSNRREFPFIMFYPA